MKIKVTKKSYEDVIKITAAKREKPKKQSPFFRWLLNALSKGELKAVSFTVDNINMDILKDDEPALFLMNHSSFTDLQIVATLLKNRPYHIVCTNDGFIGKAALMRKLGCIPTKKFITDTSLVKDMCYVTGKLLESIVMYPEASYSFDGTQTDIPDSLAKCIKLLNVPVVMIRTKGAFLRDPLYNNLQKRNVKVSATQKVILTKEDIKAKSVDEINMILRSEFTYDHFKEQKEAGVLITESFRADGLHRALYKCPKCNKEGVMTGKGTDISCGLCDANYTLSEDGTLKSGKGKLEYNFVTDWYKWERECVRSEIEDETYDMELDVNIYMLVDEKSVYDVGEGHLSHTCEGFHLTGCDGKLDYVQHPSASYSLYADYFWYEIGDMISIGDGKRQYYCFPKNQSEAIVAKARLAAEEMYKKNRA